MVSKPKSVEEQKRESREIERLMKQSKRKRTIERLQPQIGTIFVTAEQSRKIEKARTTPKKGPVGFPKTPKTVSVKQPTIKAPKTVSPTATTKQLQQQEKRRLEEFAVQSAFERRFDRPIRERLGSDQPKAPFQSKILESTLTGVGRPMSLVLGHPEIREKTLSFVAKRPVETAVRFGAETVAFPIVAGADIIGKVKKGETERAIGSAFTTATFIGLGAGVGKITPKEITFGRSLKGMAGRTKKKKKTNLKLKPMTVVTDREYFRYLKIQEKKALQRQTKPKTEKLIVTESGEIFKVLRVGKQKELHQVTDKKALKTIIGNEKPKIELLGGRQKKVSTGDILGRTKFSDTVFKQRSLTISSSVRITSGLSASGILSGQKQDKRFRSAFLSGSSTSLSFGSLQGSKLSSRQSRAVSSALGIGQISGSKQSLMPRLRTSAFDSTTGFGRRRKKGKRKGPRIPLGPTIPLLPTISGKQLVSTPSKKTAKRQLLYKPSISGIVSGRQITKVPKGKLTGLEIRPLLKSNKREKRALGI